MYFVLLRVFRLLRRTLETLLRHLERRVIECFDTQVPIKNKCLPGRSFAGVKAKDGYSHMAAPSRASSMLGLGFG